MVDLFVAPPGWARWDGVIHRCTLGRGGVRRDKREGDGATPVGLFAPRRVLFRPDRIAPPVSGLPVAPIRPDDGWCDDPDDPAYNQPVRLPYPGRHERLWRDDALYDLVIVLGYNDAPVVPGRGSAIFLHLARPDGGPTDGCIGLALPLLRRLAARCRSDSRIHVTDRRSRGAPAA